MEDMVTPSAGELRGCRSCESAQLSEVLDLGVLPLANALREPDDTREEARYPLRLVFCERCALLQIDYTVPPEKLFSTYPYFSSVSDALVEHARQLAEEVIAKRALGPSSLVVEVASNDGYLLQHYRAAGVPVLGIEPAANVAAVAESERAIPTLNAFFGGDLARDLAAEGRTADVIHAHNVLAHVADLNGFVAGLATLLAPEGVLVIEVPYAKTMLDECQFDQIYHEHLCYFSLSSLRHVFTRHALTITDVAVVPIHGGSLRLWVHHASATHAPTPSVASMGEAEHAWGAQQTDAYRAFATRTGELQVELVRMLTSLRARGERIAAYGAAAKGATLLNFMRIDNALVDFVVDRSPHKQGKRMPGVGLDILPPAALLERRPSHALLLSWNFAEEIMRQQAAYRAAGGRFIVPLPAPHIV